MGSYWAKGDRKIQVSPQATNPVTKRVHRIQRNFCCFWNSPSHGLATRNHFFSDNDSSKMKTCALGSCPTSTQPAFDGPPSFCVGETWLANWRTLPWRTDGPSVNEVVRNHGMKSQPHAPNLPSAWLSKRRRCLNRWRFRLAHWPSGTPSWCR